MYNVTLNYFKVKMTIIYFLKGFFDTRGGDKLNILQN